MVNFLNLRKFNPKEIENKRVDPNQGPASILLIGSKRTGKTFLIADLMYYFRKIPAGMIVTGSEGSYEKFAEFFPKTFIFDEINDDLIKKMENIVKRQRKLRKQRVQGDYSSLMLFDDCGYDKKVVNKKIIQGMFMNGRQWRIHLMMAVQYCKSVPPTLRTNADYIFILREPSIEERKKLWREYAGIIPKFEIFSEIMDKCTENYKCVVIDRTTNSNKIEDNIFWYKARSPSRKFKVGSKELWNYHNKHYKSEDEESEEDDPNDELNGNSKNKSKIVIKRIKNNKSQQNIEKKDV